MAEPSDWQQIAIPVEGQAVCFEYLRGGRPEPAFAIRFRNGFYAYRNRCPHAGTTLDWAPGRFFNASADMLTCQTHGACFDPISGMALIGPARSGLEPLPVRITSSALMVPAAVADGRGSP